MEDLTQSIATVTEQNACFIYRRFLKTQSLRPKRRFFVSRVTYLCSK